MQQTDNIVPVSKASSVFDRAIHFFGRSRIATPQPDRVVGNIDWHDSDTDSKQLCQGSHDQPICGGYNEAFIVQHWTSYHLR